jgi:hypothetical protein
MIEERTALSMAKLSRKLKFIEGVFKRSFLLPDRISPDEMQIVEMLFRGINEGEFTLRNETCTWTNVSAGVDLSTLPHDLPGPFSYTIASPLDLFGHKFDVGPITVRLERAALANPRTVDELKRDNRGEATIRFEVLDNQITYRFEAYVRQGRRRRTKRLTEFKHELAREEPHELVDLVDEPLQSDVSELEAGQIAMGWTLYSNLPDRYCPQEPGVDQATGHWNVPIWLVYANGEGGHVGDLLIHNKTGVIVSHTSIEEMRSKAKALAETMLHAG